MPPPISLLVAYPKEIIRAGLRSMLERTRIKVVGEAGDAESTRTLVKKHRPDVLLIDAAIPGADTFELLKKLQKSMPKMKSVVLSAIDNPTYMARARAAGASNFLLNSVSARDLTTAIENAAAGKQTPGAGAFGKVTASMATTGTSATKEARLTPRESQVLSHIAFGLSNEEIAHSLEISIETVKEHVQSLLRKVAVRDRTQAAVWAVKSGVI